MEQNLETFNQIIAELTTSLKGKLGEQNGAIIVKQGDGHKYHIYRENGRLKRDYVALIEPKTEPEGDSQKVIGADIDLYDKGALQPIELLFEKYLCPVNIAKRFGPKPTL